MSHEVWSVSRACFFGKILELDCFLLRLRDFQDTMRMMGYMILGFHRDGINGFVIEFYGLSPQETLRN